MVGESMLLITRIKEERVILSVNLPGPEGSHNRLNIILGVSVEMFLEINI